MAARKLKCQKKAGGNRGEKAGSRRSRGRQDQCHRVSAIPDMMWDRDRGWVARVRTQDHMASGPSKLQEIEPLEGDDNRQACETALTKVKCPHLDCGWELEVYPEVVHIWLQFHMDREHGDWEEDTELPETAEESDAASNGALEVNSATENGETRETKPLEKDIELVGVDSAAENGKTQMTACGGRGPPDLRDGAEEGQVSVQGLRLGTGVLLESRYC